jgi:hypothetical protein
MNTMRPSERASEEINKRNERFNENVKSGAKTVVSAALAATGARILPFLSEHIPVDLAIKGISKISPKIGDFIKKGMSQGLDVKDGFQFLKDQIQPKEEEKEAEKKPEQTKENRNIIQQYSPELHEFIQQEVQKGRTPTEAWFMAQAGSKAKEFKKIIDKIEKDHKTSFSSLVNMIYGGGQYGGAVNPQQSQQGQQQQQNQPHPGSARGKMLAADQAQMQQQQQGQQQPGQGQQALMAILQKIQQQRGG